MTHPALVDIPVSEFHLSRTLQSGQVFHAESDGSAWKILVGNIVLRVEQNDDILRVPAEHTELACRYFSLDHPLKAIYGSFPGDSFSQAALASCRGLRIIRQPRWECLGTFITSPMKQVSHIRQISLKLRARFGKPVAGSDINTYPEPSDLAAAEESSLRECGLGFRAKSLLQTARILADGTPDLETLAERPTSEIRQTLCALPGVGRKVANCVLLFAYERLDAVPVDVWIGRILQAMRHRKGTPDELERYSHRRFGPYAGYVQQYLFHHARSTRTLPT